MQNKEIINKLYNGEELNGRELAIVSDILSKEESIIPEIDYDQDDILEAFAINKNIFNQKHSDAIDFMSEYDNLNTATFLEGAMKFKSELTEAEIYAICTIYLQLVVDNKIKETINTIDKEGHGIGAINIEGVDNPEEFIEKAKIAIRAAMEKAAESGDLDDMDIKEIITKTIQKLKDDENS